MLGFFVGLLPGLLGDAALARLLALPDPLVECQHDPVQFGRLLLAERHLHVGRAVGRCVDLARSAERTRRHFRSNDVARPRWLIHDMPLQIVGP